LVFGLLAASLAGTGMAQAGPATTVGKPNIYDETADGSKQIADALALAGQDGKRVLLQFGANWCPWCHKLHTLFEKDKSIKEQLKSDYVVVLIDVNKGRNSEVDMKYGHPTRLGLPVLVVLNAGGKQLTTKNSGELEEGDHHNPEKVMAFLKKWSPHNSQLN
jgi:thiol:disulfide interchange protein